MICQTLTLKSIQARPVVLKLKRPVIARIATLTDWPLILIDLYTEEGVIGRAYLEPYIPKSMRYLIPATPFALRFAIGPWFWPAVLFGLIGCWGAILMIIIYLEK
jgi:hypothetical protein